MQWFRVELDETGKMVSSRIVDLAEKRDGKPSVYYFRASDAKSAAQLAYRECHRVRQQARREQYKKEQRCKCGRSREKETLQERALGHCPACLKLKRQDDARRVLRAKGLPTPPIDKAARFTDRRNEEKRELLIEVREQLLRLNMGPFGEWLNAQIEALTEKQPPKLRVVGSK